VVGADVGGWLGDGVSGVKGGGGAGRRAGIEWAPVVMVAPWGAVMGGRVVAGGGAVVDVGDGGRLALNLIFKVRGRVEGEVAVGGVGG
jgi:hypothetical protein